MARSAVVVPGRRLGPYAPLTLYAALAAQARGATVEFIEWQPPTSLGDDPAQLRAWVVDQVAPVLDGMPGEPLLIGKSLGTYAAALAAERGLPAVWYTPLLHDEAVVGSLRACTRPVLLIGGTADIGAWDGQLAQSLTPHVCQITDADHGMIVPGGLIASAVVLGEVTTAVEAFLDNEVWTDP